eukprot:EG_transcript_4882
MEQRAVAAGQTELLQDVLPLLAQQTPRTLQQVLDFLRNPDGQTRIGPKAEPRGWREFSSLASGERSPNALDGRESPVISADPNLMFSPVGPPCPVGSPEGGAEQDEDAEGSHLIEPQPRDLDLSDPDSIETSLTAIHRSIDYGYELSNIMRSCSSFTSLHSWDDLSNHNHEDGARARCVSPLTRSLSTAIFQRRLAFRAKKEEFYPETDRDPLILVTVGLPARGKSYVARRLCRYMGWKGVPCRIFNAGHYRRMLLGADQHADFFDATNKAAKAAREKMAQMAANDLIDYIRQGGQIGIFDATNTTRMRRQHVVKVFTQELGLPVSRIIFLEMVCNDKKMVEHNILEVKLKGKDYEGVDPTAAYADFKNREAEYMKVYETLELSNDEDKKMSFVKMVDAGESLVTHKIVGALPKSIVQFAGFLKPFAGHLYVTVNGETPDIIAGRLGVNSDLAPSGKDLARRLEAWADKLGYETMHVWCAPTNAGMQTAQPFLSKKKKFHVQVWRALMDIDYGKFQGKTYYEVRKYWPKVWEALKRDEYFYTWPGGESPCALVQRLDPILMAMEGKTAPILIICSRTVCRAILSYCCDLIPEQFTRIKLPKNVIFDIDMNAEPVRVDTCFV